MPEFPTLFELLRHRAEERPDHDLYTFLAEGEEVADRLTHAGLDRRARALAARLQELGGAGERALLLYPPGLDFVAAFFGCLYAGVVAVPSYPPRPRREQPALRAIARDAEPRFVLTTAGYLARRERLERQIPELRGARWLATEELGGGAAEWRPPASDGDGLAFLQYTSGSTSTPKGVMVRHRHLVHNEEMIRRAFGTSEESVIVGWLPLYHDMGLIGNVLQPLYAGARCVMMSPVAFLQRPRRWLAAIDRYRATVSGGPNFAYELCVRKAAGAAVDGEGGEGLDLSSWRVAFNGAEPVRAETLARFAETFAPAGFDRRAFYPCYGLAEATLFVSGGSTAASPVEEGFASAELERGRAVTAEADPGGADPGGVRLLVASGRAWLDQEVRVCDPETRAPLAAGEVGEIWISGPSVAGGYWRRPEATAATFEARPAGGSEGPYLRTGDLGFLHDGELFVTGRLKDLLIIRGRNHYPQDLELTAERSHPALRSGGAAAFSVEVAGEERPVLMAELERRREDEAAEVAEAVRQAVSEGHELQLHEVVLVRAGTVPKTTSGKIRRHACRAGYLAGTQPVLWRSAVPDGGAATEVAVPGREELLALSPEERRRALRELLVAVAARLLRREPGEVDPDRPLTALGLDSLAAVELSHEAESGLGVELPLSELLSGATLSALAEGLLERLEGESGRQLPRPRPGGAVPEFPLSHGQRALWFLERLAPESAAYNIAVAVRVRGGAAPDPATGPASGPASGPGLDAAALERALLAVGERHPALRTTFHPGSGSGSPLQRVHPRPRLDFAVETPSGAGAAELGRRLAADAHRPFDLERGPLVRVRIHHPGDGGGPVFLLVVHHLVADFWSLAVVAEELAAFYRHQTGGPALVLSPPALRYADFVRWQEELLEGEQGEELWRYWRRRLAGEEWVLDLPTDRPRRAAPSHRGGARYASLEPRLMERLRSLGRERGATLFTALLAGFQALLHRYTGQPRLLVGTPTAGRRAPELRELVGYLVNPVPLRADFDDRPSFGALVERLRETTVGALAHQEMPFPLLAERLQPSRQGARSPLVQALFVLQKSHLPGWEGLGAAALGLPGVELRLGELEVETVAIPERRPQFDLTLTMAEVGEGLGACLEYDAELWDGATAERMLGHLGNLLRGAVADPERGVDELPLLAAGERTQLLVEWSGVPAPYPGPWTLVELFEAAAARSPEAPAVAWGGELWSYRELAARASRVAHRLRCQGVTPESRVAVCVERSARLVAALLGVLEAGGAYVPLDPAYPRARLELMLEDSGASVLVSEERYRELFAGLESEAWTELWLEELEEPSAVSSESPSPEGPSSEGPSPESPSPESPSPESLAYVIYTSGSTGRPKGVAIPHRSASTMVHWAGERFSAEELSGVLAATSVCFDLSVFELFAPLCHGGCVIGAADALALASLPEPARERVRLVNTVPSAAAELLRLGAVPEGVRAVCLAGEPLDRSLVSELYSATGTSAVWNLYGPSEDTTYSTEALQSRAAAGPVPIGRALPGGRAYVASAHLRPQPVGVAGELYLGGAGVARGYLGRGALTAERFVPDPFGGRGERLYRTGDLVRWSKSGELHFLGRIDHQVKVRGYRIELGEIESAAASETEVRESVAVVAAGASGDPRVVLYAAPAELPGEELRERLAERLPGYLVPSAVVVLEALPRLPNGKVDRSSLPAPPGAAARGDRVAPRTPVEATVAELFGELLGVEGVGAHDDFFELGGHSLLAARLVARVREALGVEPPLLAVFEAPTVAGLAARVDAADAGAAEPPIVPRSAGEGPPPLSFQQRRLWFLERLAPGRATYHLPARVRLRGELRLPAFAAALAEIVRRHRVLRTGVEVDGGEPRARVAPPAFALPVVELGGLPPALREAESARLESTAARRPFDLERGPLIRCWLLRLAGDEHRALVVLHHLAADGWSIGVVGRELSTLYPAFAAGRPSPLPPPPIQYDDYAAWQRRWLRGAALEERVGWWRQRLGERPPVLELPTDRPRPSLATEAGGSRRFTLPPELVAAVERSAREAGGTPFMTLLAAFQALLARTAGVWELTVGTPVANRDRVELEGLVGFFVNTVALRTHLADRPTFRRLEERVRRVALEAFDHRDLPFEVLVEALRPERVLSHNPLFQVVFAYQEDAAADGVLLPGLEVAVEELDTGTSKFDLTLFLERRGGAMAGRFEYPRELFDDTRMARLAGHFRSLLAAAVAEPGARVDELPLLSPAERHQLLREWPDPGWPADGGEPAVHRLVAGWAERRPEAIAVRSPDGDLSYRELARRAARLAHHLHERGVGPETPVGVCLPRSAETVVALLAILQAGGAYLPLDPSYPERRLAFMVEDAGVRVVVTRGELLARLPTGGVRAVCLDRDRGAIAAGPHRPPPGAVDGVAGVDGERLAYVIYTSGSTGRPKGVAVRHRGLSRLCGWHRRAFAVGPESRATLLASLSFDASVWELWPYLAAGASVRPVSRRRAADPAGLVALFARERISHAFLATPLAEEVLAPGPPAAGSLRVLLTGGDRLRQAPPPLPFRFVNNYGPTEATVVATSGAVPPRRPGGAASGVPPAIGRPIDGTPVRILDRGLRPVPAGVPGELAVAGGLARGYLGRPALTAGRFVPDPHPGAGTGGGRLYRTGDLARWRADGEVEFLGRIDHQVKVRGYRIELGEVEAVLAEHPAVRATAVIVHRRGPAGGELVAYLTAEPGRSPSPAELRGFLETRLAGYMVPAAFVVLDAFPMTPGGKVDRGALPAPELGRGSGGGAPRDPVEEAVVALLADELGVPEVGVHDDFFELGGHSLLAARVVARIERTFGRELPLRALFEAPTAAGLARAVSSAGRAGREPAAPIPPQPRPFREPPPLSFSQRRLWFLDRLHPGDAAYHLPAAVRLRGRLDRPAFTAAVAAIVRRHEVLRTTFGERGGEPVQRIAPPAPFPPRSPLPRIDLAALPTAAAAEEERRLAEREARRPFDLEGGPLLRALLVERSADYHLAVIVMHHAVADGWSVGVLERELAALYGAFAERRPAPLPPLSVQYADWAVAEHRRHREGALGAELEYWRARLEDPPPPLELASDRPRRGARGPGASLPLVLPAAVGGGVREVARRVGGTRFSVLLAAFQGLLARSAGVDELTVGTPVANRGAPELEGLIGFFVNTLVVRADLGGDPTFADLLERTREASLGAVAHQRLPFELLVEELQPERELERTPFFQVMFVLQDAPLEPPRLPGLEVALEPLATGATKFDLTLFLEPRGERIDGRLEYRADLFDRTRVARLAGHLRSLLEAGLAVPERRLSELPLLSPAERHQLLREENDTRRPHPFPGLCLHQLVAERAARAPAAVAVVFEPPGGPARHLTYGGLVERARRLAGGLRRRGVAPEVPVALLLERSEAMVVALLGVHWAGGAYLPLDPSFPAPRLAATLRDAAPPVLITDRRSAGAVPDLGADGPGVVTIGEASREPLEEPPAGAASAPAVPGNLAYLIYTSGSTGTPKGVGVEHRHLLAYAGAVLERLELGDPERDEGASFATVSTLAADLGNTSIFGALVSGGTVHVLAEEVITDPEPMADAMVRRRIDCLKIVPSHLAALLGGARPERVLPRRRLIVGGEATGWSLAERLRRLAPGCRIVNHYGPTEATVGVATWRFGAAGGVVRRAAHLPLGRPLPGSRLVVADRRLRAVPPAIPGELLIAGATVARGYLGRPARTAEGFVPDPFPGADPGGRLYRTGDLCRRLPDGTVDFLGRVDHQVKVRGYRIELGEVEAAIRELGAGSAAALVIDDDAGERRLVAFATPGPAAPAPDPGELLGRLRARLPAPAVPALLLPLDALPLTANGKLDRRSLARRARTELGVHRPEAPRVAPRTATEEILAGLWAELLGRGAVGVEDDFFALGGHSLLATRLVSRARRAFAVDLPLRALFEAPTVAALAARIDAARRGAAEPLPPLEASGEEGPSPLSPAQERLWFLDRLDPGRPTYNLPYFARLEGPLDRRALAAGLGEVTRRHPVLRASFPTRGGHPVQEVAPVAPFPLPVVDLRRLPVPARRAEARRRTAAAARRPFDLERGPLVRASLLRLGAEEHLLLLDLHHTVSDAWSRGLLIRELSALYGAFRAGRRSPLPEPPIRYADFARWQRRLLDAGAFDRQLDYWRRQLRGVPALDLPTDRPRSASPASPGATLRGTLPPGLARRLGELGRERGATLFMTLLAAFATLLHRLTGEVDVAVGSPIAGRNRLELEGLIGFFVNTLVLRTDLGGDPTFGELLERAREVALGADSHQDVPFERVVTEVEVARDLETTPLFQTLLVLQNVPMAPPELPGLEVTPVEADVGAAKFELTVVMTEGEEGELRESWEYRADLFDATTVERFRRHLRSLLESAAAEPGRRISALPLLSAAARHQLVAEWNPGPPSAGALAADPATLDGLLAAQAVRTPSAPAVVWGEERWSYAELRARAARVASRLCALGVGPESRVAVCAERSAALVAALWGILGAGAAYVPLDPAYPRRRLELMVADSGAAAVVTEGRWLELFGADGAERETVPLETVPLETVLLEEVLAEPVPGEEGWRPEPRSPSRLAYVIYTSGSTGRPKGVAIPHRSAAALVHWAGERFSAEELSGVLAATSVCFDLSVFELFAPLCHGGCVIGAADALALASLPEPARERVRLVNTVPSAAAELLRLGAVPAGVRTVCLAGEPLDRSLVSELYSATGTSAVWNLYGPSEDTTYSTEALQSRAPAGPVPIGRALPGGRAYVASAHLRPQPVGVAGELYLGGAGVARGYLGRGALTAERFVPDPFGGRGERLYRTGDLVRWSKSGELHFLGRIDHQVKVRGYRIELGEIESVAAARPEVTESVAVVREDAPGDPRVVLYAAPAELPGEALREALAAVLPGYAVPSAVVVLEALPRLPNGKVDRSSLPAPSGAAASRGYVAPRTGVEETVAELFEELLGVERVGAHDGFFDLGGHSLLAARLVARVRGSLGVELPLRGVFEAPTVAALAAAVERRRGGEEPPPIEPAPAGAEPVLSFAQERLWFLHQLEPNDPSYNIPAAFRLRGPLDPAALRGGFGRLAARQDVLRTTFRTREGRAVAEVAADAEVALPWVDLERLPPARREAEAARLFAAEAARPFDLGAAPLLRATLLRLREREHLLTFVLHHVAGDGWSVGVLRRELAHFYRRLAVGGGGELPPLPVRYADFAHWQRRWLRGEVLDRQLDHWRRRLAGVPVLELPTDRPRPPVQSWNGAVERRPFPADLRRRAEELGRASGATLFMTLLALFGALLERLTGQEDVAIGTPVANRPRAELEGLIGFFVNTLVLRLDLGGEPTFPELLTRVRETALDAYDHQDLPFEKLVDELRPERSLSRSPLFQVMFTLAEGLREPPELVGLEATPVELDEAPAKFDLAPSVEPDGDGLLFHLGYNADLFDRTTARRFLDHYETLLRGALAAPERRISELPLLAAAERHQLTREWGVGAAGAGVECPVHRLFEERAAAAPGSVALHCGGEEVSYGELDRRAGELALRLRRLGLAPGTPVALCLERSPEIAVGTLGIWKAGCAFVPLDPSYPAARLAFQLEDARPPVVVTSTALAPSLPDHDAAVLEIDRPEADAAGDVLGGDVPDGPDRLAYLIYTSGTTGRPKAVAVEHRHLAHTLGTAGRSFGFDAGDVALFMASFAFDISLFEWLTPLLAGGAVRILRREELLDPERLLDHLGHATVVHAVPSLARVMVDALDRGGAPAEGPSPRRIFVGGDAVPAELLRDLRRSFPGARVEVLYGPTEATIVCASHPVSADPGVRPMIGRPLGGVTLHLLDRRRRPVPPGVVGEIHVAGPGVTRGYLGRDELTAERYPEIGGRRYYRTGDLARWRADGHLEFLGRADHQVKIRGHRIELGEVEAVLGEHPALRQVVAAAVADGGEPRLVAYLVAAEDAEVPGPGELRRFLGDRLPDHVIPAAFVPLDELPLTPAGKVDRRALPAPEEERPELRGEYAEPTTEAEKTLAEIWARVLRIDRVGVRDNFFELGGDSILSIQILSHAARAGLHLTPKQMFEHQTVAELAAVAGDAPSSTAEQGLVVGPVPLLPVQRFFFEEYRRDLHHFAMPLLLTVDRPLDGGRLAWALHHLLLHHDTLRLRVERGDGGWRGWIPGAEGAVAPVLAVDLSAVPEARQGGAITAAGSQLMAGLDLEAGPLVRAVTFHRGRDTATGEPRSGRLLLAPHHLVVDGVSWRILLEDLQAAGEQLERGGEVRLPPKTTSVKAWAERLAEHASSEELRRQLQWWRSRSDTPAATLPAGTGGAGQVTVGLDEDETRSLLHEVPPVYNTRIQEVLLTALAVACRKLTGVPAVWVDLESHGREERWEDVDLTRTVGWLTSIHPVLLDLGGAEGPGEALKAVKEELRSVPDHGLGFGVLRYLSDDPEVASAVASVPRPEIAFNYLGQLDLGVAEDSPFRPAPESPGRARSPRQPAPHPVSVDARLTGSRLELGWSYRGGRIGGATVEELARRCLEALRALIEHCRSPEAGGYTASDFGLADLDEDGIEAALDEIELEDVSF